jgi:hypothetical protein
MHQRAWVDVVLIATPAWCLIRSDAAPALQGTRNAVC